MPRYDEEFSQLAERAILDVGIDLATYIDVRTRQGMTVDAIRQALEDDVSNRGPIFGKFIRALTGASKAAVMTSVRQGEIVGAAAQDAELRKLIGLSESGLELIIDEANPADAEEIELALQDDLLETSIAELVNTCEECLPLHGKTMSRRRWRESGLLPESRHSGWTNPCKCRMIPASIAEGKAELAAPLLRVAEKGTKRTARSIGQGSIDSAQSKVDQAVKSKKGRRMLRRLGKALG